MVVTLGQQYNAGEKLTVMLYTYYINRHAGTPDKSKQNPNSSSVIDPCTIKASSLEHEQCYML